MHLPFTATEFIGIFARYNATIGPLPLLAYALAAASMFLALRPREWGHRLIGYSLAGMWAFTGIGYHVLNFSAINPAARLFGGLFVVEAVALTIATARGRLRFDFDIRRFRSQVGLAMIAFSAVVYPLIGLASGHGYPNGPVFGLTPCPLVIYTFGLLMLTDRTLPKHLVAIPMAWALVGSTAAITLGIREDTGLLVTGALATVSLLARRADDALEGGLKAAPAA